MAAEGVQSVDRVFHLLEHLADGGASVSLSELSQRAKLPMPTIHRLLQSLIRQGYVRQEPSKRYALGPRMIRLGEAAGRNLGSWSTPYLARLVDAFGETANMAMLEHDACVYVAQVPSPQSVRMFTEVGRVVPVHSTGVGKALLAQLDDAAVGRIVRRAGLPARTESTIRTEAALHAAIAEVRRQGFAVDDEEQELGVRCVAVPVAGGSPAWLAVSVSGPVTRMTPGVVARAVPLLTAAARRLAGEVALP